MVNEYSSTEALTGISDRRRWSKKVILIIIAAVLAIVAVIAIPIAVTTKSARTKRFITARPEDAKEVENLRVRIVQQRGALDIMTDRFKVEIQHRRIEYRDDETACLGSDLTRTCVEGNQVKVITSTEVEYVTKLLVSVANISPKFEVDVLILFKKYCAKYAVEYKDHEMFTRYLSMFRHDLLRMEKHNQNIKKKYTMGYYTWLSEDTCKLIPPTDYSGLFDGLGEQPFKHTPFLFEANDEYRATFDWREGGYIPRMDRERRKKVNTDWMLAASAMYDAFVAIKKYKRQIHSAQQIADCASYSYENGKQNLEKALNYFTTCGICLEAQYPFTGEQEACKEHLCRGRPIVKSVVKIDAKNAEKHLKENGPFITAFSLPSDLETGYTDGVYNEKVNAWGGGVTALVVGYGTDIYKRKYWIIQATWSMDPNWGEDGYFRITDEAAQTGKGIFDNAYGLSNG